MNKLIGFVKVLVVIFVILSMTVVGGVLAVYYENWEKDLGETDSNLAQFLSGKDKKEEKKVEPKISCLVMGRNQSLTDFIVLAQFDPNTREASLLSIPRDSFVSQGSPDGKINSIYANYGGGEKGILKLKEKVEEIVGFDIDYYLLFNAQLLKDVVNALGGVTVDVPIDMNYDDPYQNPPLHIHLKKGVQRLTGSQAEQFVRFRKGYANQDLGRIQAQQTFIKALVSELLKAENLPKIKNIVDIVLEGTKTNITLDVVEDHLGQVVTFKMDRMRMETLPGVAENRTYAGVPRSYYILDEEKCDALIDELFNKSIDGGTGDSVGNMVPTDKEVAEEVFGDNLTVSSGETSGDTHFEEIKIELLIAKANVSKVKELAKILSDNGCNVVKLGNYDSINVEPSRIICYGKNSEGELEFLKEISGVKKVEESDEVANVKFTIIVGQNY